MFTSRITKLGTISLGLLSCLFSAEASNTNFRQASLEEIQALFNLATVSPQRERIVADITTYEPKWSQDQIATAIEQQNELFPDMKRLPEAVQRDRTNAVARSHSGIRILHVQEWYSGNLYRLDQTDEDAVSEQYLTNHLGAYRESYIDIDDPTLSPYRSFTVNHQLHSAMLSKIKLWAKNDLWRASGLDQEVVLPLIVALVDPKSLLKGHGTDADLNAFKLDPAKAERIHNGSDPIWHLEAINEGGPDSRTRFILSAIKPYGLSDQGFAYIVGRIGQTPVCLEASATNYTTHSSFISTREDFDNQGFPRVWKRTTITPGSPTKQIDVVFNEVETNAAFNDAQEFLPVFPTNYIVSDATSDNAKILQNPQHAKIAQSETNAASVKRMVILCVMGLLTLGGSALFLYNARNHVKTNC